MPSDAAKKARTCLTKCLSLSLSFSQCARSWLRSTSSTVQKLACAGATREVSGSQPAGRAVTGWAPLQRMGRGRGRTGGGAKGHLVLLVHLPDLLVLDREQHEAVGVRGQEGIGRRHGPLWVGWLLCSSLLSFRTALPGKPGFGGTGQLPNIDIMKLFIFPGRVLLHLC